MVPLMGVRLLFGIVDPASAYIGDICGIETALARFAMCIPVSASQLKPALIGHDGCGNRNTGKTDKANANSRRSLNGKECAGENALPRTRDA